MTGYVLPVAAIMRQKTNKTRLTTPRVRKRKTVFPESDGEVIK